MFLFLRQISLWHNLHRETQLFIALFLQFYESFLFLWMQNQYFLDAFGNTVLLADKNVTKSVSEFHCLSLCDTSWYWLLENHSISLNLNRQWSACMPNTIGWWARCKPHAFPWKGCFLYCPTHLVKYSQAASQLR